MRRRLSALAGGAFLVCAQWAAADSWHVVRAESDAAGALEYRRVELRNDNGDEVTLDLAMTSAKTTKLRMLDNTSGDDDLAEAMKRSGFVAGVNGGYFDPQFRPLGLRVIDGMTTSPMSHARLLTGVLCASARGIEILRVKEFSPKKKYDTAVECGPFLVDRGLPLTTLDRTRSARRTFALVTRDGKAALGVASDLTLADLAEALAAPELKVMRAMNLDGGSSTAFWCRRDDGVTVSIREYKNVRDFVAFGP